MTFDGDVARCGHRDSVVCAIYETAGADLELCVGYAADRTFRADRLADAESARARGQQWLGAFRPAGFVPLVLPWHSIQAPDSARMKSAPRSA